MYGYPTYQDLAQFSLDGLDRGRGDLADDLEKQSEETVNFIYTLLQ
jgi:hypothetical protein